MYSLSSSSRKIVENLDDLLTMKVYFSDNLPNELGNTRRFLQDILEEYGAWSDDVRFFFHNPESDTDLEEQARKDGIQPVQMQVIENDKVEIKKVYLGMVLLYENKKEVIPVIQTTAGLEYMISTKIKSLIDIDKKTIAVDTEKFETSHKGIYAVGDICNYPGKLKLILSGFHEGALAARACFKLARPDEKYRFEFTTSSKTIKDRLGVKE